ncbi:hypothetical protein [Thiofilum flexile]|uniref:hypothetical protein n=1 Tax=Thiofilum flexile TaxID=125627 RepID=UPI000381C85D|nr:hypothetical protein [Thiofilum flexile]
MLGLYYVDDERGMKKFIKSYIEILNKNQKKIDFNNKNMYCGEGAVDAFFNEVVHLDSDELSKYLFLLDVRMPVPRGLNNADVWGEYRGARSDVCGFALARYLLNKKIKINQIRLFSAYRDIINNEIINFFDSENDWYIFISKYDLDVVFFEEWLKDLSAI